MPRHTSHLRRFELRRDRDFRQHGDEWQYGQGGYGEGVPRRLSRDTLGPQEDVVERRRRNRRHVNMGIRPGGASRNLLAENIFFLILLAAALYGMYRLSLYVINP